MLGRRLPANAQRAAVVLAAGALGCALCIPLGCEDQVERRPPRTPLDKLVERIAEITPKRIAAAGISGAAIAVVGPRGFTWTRGFGHTDSTRTSVVDPDTLFSLQSATKLFTATAVMSAVEEGALELDTPITRWLPDFTVRSRFAPRPQDRITLRLLLSHRAGFTHEAPRGNNLSNSTVSFDEHVASIPDTWLRFPVGDRSAYSNLGVDLAGAALQAADDIPYAESVRQRVLAPAGMHRSRFATTSLRDEPNRAVGTFAGKVPPLVIPIQASGGLYSSANDLARFLHIAIDRGAPLVDPTSWSEMERIAAPVSDFQSRGLGLGLVVNQLVDDRVVSAGHTGGGYGFQSELRWLPEVGIGFALLVNSDHAFGLAAEIGELLRETARKLAGRDPFQPGSALSAVARCRESSAAGADLTRLALGAYTSRSKNAIVTRHHDTFGVFSGTFHPMCFVTDEIMISPDRQLHDAWRLSLTEEGRPERLTGLNSGTVYDYNDGPGDTALLDEPVPDGAGRAAKWRTALGTWKYHWLGTAPHYLTMYEAAGALYFDDLRLEQFEPGLFFASNGEVLDLTTEPSTWRSIPIEKHAIPLSAVQQGRALDRARGLYALLRSASHETFLAESTDAIRQDLGNRLPAIWRDLLDAYGAAGPTGVGRADVIGERTHVRLSAEFAHGPRTFNVMLDENGRADGFWLNPTPPRSWHLRR